MAVFNATQSAGSGNPANKVPVDPKVVSNGADADQLLQPADRAAYSETPADIAAALVVAGIMNPA